jgi:hypothetical protein
MFVASILDSFSDLTSAVVTSLAFAALFALIVILDHVR